MRSRRAVLFGVAATAFAPAALAYVPPADFLLGRVADRRKNVKTLTVKGIRSFVGRSFEGGKQDVSETLYANVKTGAYRLERKTPKGIYVEVSDGTKRVSVSEGKTGLVETDPRPLERLLFTGGEEEDLMRAAQAFGIRPEITGLGRVDGQVAWVIGAKEGDAVSPQLWIGKERSHPLELRDPRAKRVVRFEGWGEPGGAGVVPTRVSILRGDEVVETLKVEQTKVNPKLGADLFKPEAPVLATPTPKPKATPKPR